MSAKPRGPGPDSRPDSPAPAPEQALHALVDGIAARGTRPALVQLEQEGMRTWTCAELGGQARELARGLLADGLQRGEAVGVFAANSAQWVIAALGVMRAGGMVVPLDVQLDGQSLRHELADSEARRVFTDAQRRARLQELDLDPAPELNLLDQASGSGSWRELLRGQDPELPELEGKDGAALFYTSGTTGKPKGVPLTHANLSHQFRAVREAGLVNERDRVLLPLPLHHVYPFVMGMLMPLALGLPLILPAAITGPQIAKALKKGEASVLVGVPRLYRALLEGIQARIGGGGRLAAILFQATLGAATWARRRLGLNLGRRLLAPLHRRIGPRLRLAASGGSPLAPDLAWTLEGLGWDVAIGYGITETSPLLTIKLPGQSRLDSVGRPIPGVELRVDEQVSGAGEGGGEILVRGPNVFAGYRGLPQQSRESFTQDGWFRTGDLGRLDQDGNLQLVGRVSTVIVTEGGKNIQPDELEEIYVASPLIREVGVLQSEGALAALVVPEPLDEPPERVRERVGQALGELGRRLPSYKHLAHVAITREALPRTRLGKIRRQELAARYEQARSGEQGEGAAGGPMPLEQMSGEDRALLDNPAAWHVWQWLGRRYPERRITPDTDPGLDLGVDSMEWMNLTLDISEQLGVELDEAAIGRIASVRDLLVEVNEARAGAGRRLDLANAPEQSLSEVQRRWLRPLPPIARALAPILYGVNWLLVRGLFRLRVQGAGGVPDDAQILLAPSHASYLDPFVVAAALPYRTVRRVYWGGWTGAAFGNPLARALSRLSQVVPIDPEQGVISSLAFGAAVLKNGHSLVWFPEGRRSSSGELQDFKQGVGMLLESYPVQAVPAAIAGAHEAMAPGRPMPVPFRRISIAFGEPASAEALAGEGEGDEPRRRIVSALRARIAALARALQAR